MSPKVQTHSNLRPLFTLGVALATLVGATRVVEAGQAQLEQKAASRQSAAEQVAPAAPEELPETAWSAFKSRLSAAGVDAGVSYLSDWSRMPKGTSASPLVGRGLMDSTVSLDLEKLAGLKGATIFMDHQWMSGSDASGALGIYQYFSNIDNANFQSLYELWYEQKFDGERIRLKAGRVDANSEFAAVDAAGDFINASMGFSPTIYLLPTYPSPAPSLNLFADPHPQLNLGVGVYGSQTGTARWRQPFLIAQATGRWSLADGLDGYLRVGAWKQNQDLEEGLTMAASGRYVVAEQTVWRAASGPEGTGDLKVFGQFGFTNSPTDAADRHLGGGLILNGLGHRRPNDAFGVGATYIRMGTQSDFAGASELAFGPFLRLKVAPWLSVIPDFQYVRNPGGDPDATAAAIGTLRLSAEF